MAVLKHVIPRWFWPWWLLTPPTTTRLQDAVHSGTACLPLLLSVLFANVEKKKGGAFKDPEDHQDFYQPPEKVYFLRLYSLLALLQLDSLNGGTRIQNRSYLKAPALGSQKGETENEPREVTEKEWCGHRKDNTGWGNPRTKYQTLPRGPKKQPLIPQSVDD